MAATGSTSDGLPTRPYSAPDQLGGNAPRTAELFKGANGDPGNIATSAGQDNGLTMNAQQFRAQTPTGVRAMSVLQSLRPSGNGMSAQDRARVLPGGYTLPTQNGQSQSSWSASNYLRMQGPDAI